MSSGERFVVEFDDNHQPVGDKHPKFVSQQGVIVRNLLITPVGKTSWRGVEKESKEKMLENVKEKFDIGDLPGRVKEILSSMGKKWREFRYRLKKNHYDIYETNKQRLANPPPHINESEWRWLVLEYWGTEKVQEMCQKNKENREAQQILYYTGRKSFASIEHEEVY